MCRGGLGFEDKRLHGRRGDLGARDRRARTPPPPSLARASTLASSAAAAADALLLDRCFGGGLGGRKPQPVGLAFEDVPGALLVAGLDIGERGGRGRDLGGDRLEVGDGDAALRDRGAEPVGEAALQAFTALDLDASFLEPARRGVTSGARGLEACAGHSERWANAASASDAASQRPSACSRRRRASLRLARAARHSSWARLPRSSVRRTLMARSSMAATDCSLSSASRGVASSSRSVSRRTITSAPSSRCEASSHAARSARTPAACSTSVRRCPGVASMMPSMSFCTTTA